MRPILGCLITLIVASVAIADDPPTLHLKFISWSGSDGSYQIQVDHAILRIPSVYLEQEHHVSGTLYKVAEFSRSEEITRTQEGKFISRKDLSKLVLIHEVTGRTIELKLGDDVQVENPDARVPQFKSSVKISRTLAAKPEG